MPVIGPGAGAAVAEGATFNVRGVLGPQLFVALTLTLPELLLVVTVILVVPKPLVIVQPLGTVQEYPVAPVTAAIEYVTLDCPVQGTKFPVIGPGVTGGFEIGDKARVVDSPLPQPFVATTKMLPGIVPDV